MNTVKRVAPTSIRRVTIAEKNRLAAAANIDRKISLLQGWSLVGLPIERDSEGNSVLDQGGYPKIDYFPRTVRQFNNWDGSQNAEGIRDQIRPIRRNANDTLRKDKARHHNVKDLIALLLKQKSELVNGQVPEKVARLKRELASERSRISKLEVELIEGRRATKQLERELAKQTDISEIVSKEARNAIAVLSAEVERLKSENSTLAQQLLKVRPLHNVPHKKI